MDNKKSGYDPGWNDPPPISYERGCEITANAPAKRTLNKRVAVPMDRPYGVGASIGVDPTIPPLPIDVKKIGTPPSKPICPPAVNEVAINNSNIDGNLRDNLKNVLHNLRSCDDWHGVDEISRRINVMENMWLDNKFDTVVMKKIIDLADALKSKDLETADKIQKGLMVDHVSQCSSWMSGIRQLINRINSSQAVEPDVE